MRALAVALVVAGHVGVPGLEGGFVGVDVFFVISGFVITRLLAAEQRREGRIDVLAFYARRVRRLIPALALMVAATLIAGAVVLPPLGEQQGLAASALATAGFVSNAYFWRAKSYFGGDLLPLLHTWTLAVEEQFYIVWPWVVALAALAARRLGRGLGPSLFGLLVAGGALSLAICIATTAVQPMAAFYLTPARAWEFAAGALLALAPGAARPRPRLGLALSLGGLAALGAAAALFGPFTPFPGYFAILPVAGATALIAGGGWAPASAVSRLLSTPPMQVLGRLSYGWYLWHWPLLALTRSWRLGESNLPQDAACAVVALGLAALSYRFVEDPIRRRRPGPFATTGGTFACGAVMLGLCAALAGGLGWMAHRALTANPELAALRAAKAEQRLVPVRCVWFVSPLLRLAPAALPPARGCRTGAAQASRTILLWGDSHADRLTPGLSEAARRSGLAVLVRVNPGCRPHVRRDSPWFSTRQVNHNCAGFNRLVLGSLDEARAREGVTAVVIAARWTGPGVNPDWEGDLRDLVGRVRAKGLPVVLVAPGVTFPFDVPACLVRRPAEACSLGRAQVEADNASAKARLERIAQASGAVLVDPVQVLCGPSRCPAMEGSVPLYADAHHLTAAGSLKLAPRLAEAVEKAIQAR